MAAIRAKPERDYRAAVEQVNATTRANQALSRRRRDGALYHVTARGNAREEIFRDDADRLTFLDLLCREIAQ
jgi:hypothetical protein